MKEFVTEAIVLNLTPSRENDRTVALFTKDCGKIDARVVAGRNLLSKFAPHLDPLNLIRVRLVKKNSFTLADAFTENRFTKLRENTISSGNALRLLSLLTKLLPIMTPEPRVWHSLRNALETCKFDFPLFLKLIGYDPLHASCAECNKRPVDAFTVDDQTFLCVRCARIFPESDVVLLH